MTRGNQYRTVYFLCIIDKLYFQLLTNIVTYYIIYNNKHNVSKYKKYKYRKL